MPRIDFYLLDSDGEEARLDTACRLVEKAWKQGLRSYLRADTTAEAQALDTRLWTFRKLSFVPHRLQQSGRDAPVLIGTTAVTDDTHPLLVNLGRALPEDFERYQRIVEIVDPDTERREASRVRYKIYRDRGYTPGTIKLK
ncbi:DNA polymerase III chi subunit [Plasticicumulans acidivorans]|uniref:DNA polymerase III chi subunit n=2 Tax=Plasticicumulans acidivorans TaxID=886464 RepID=A0A317MQI1_9GAMM|nr:DNA polymerase III chi subunit [Plasticicumulans acidivorans]